VGAHPRAEANRPPLPAFRGLRRPVRAVARLGVTLAEAAARADELAKGGNERELADLRREWADELEVAARSADYRERAAAYRAIGRFRVSQQRGVLGRGWQDEGTSQQAG